MSMTAMRVDASPGGCLRQPDRHGMLKDLRPGFATKLPPYLTAALSHEPFLLVITHPSAGAGVNDSNTLGDRSRAVRPPLLARCDNARPAVRAAGGTNRELG